MMKAIFNLNGSVKSVNGKSSSFADSGAADGDVNESDDGFGRIRLDDESSPGFGRDLQLPVVEERMVAAVLKIIHSVFTKRSSLIVPFFNVLMCSQQMHEENFQ